MRTEVLEESQPDELFLFDISHPYGPTGHRQARLLRTCVKRAHVSALVRQLPALLSRALPPTERLAMRSLCTWEPSIQLFNVPTCTLAGIWLSCSSA